MLETDKLFTGSIPESYDRYMVPLIFAPFAADLAQRAASLSPSAVLEIAAGTGAVTRALAPKTVPRRKLYRNRPEPADGRLCRIATTCRPSHQVAPSGCSGAAV